MNLCGTLVEMGDLRDGNGDQVVGVLIECTRDDLRACDLRMYEKVKITNVIESDEEHICAFHLDMRGTCFVCGKNDNAGAGRTSEAKFGPVSGCKEGS